MSAFPRKPVSELALVAVGAIPLLLLVEWTYSIAFTPSYTAGQTHILTSFLVVVVGVLRPRRSAISVSALRPCRGFRLWRSPVCCDASTPRAEPMERSGRQ